MPGSSARNGSAEVAASSASHAAGSSEDDNATARSLLGPFCNKFHHSVGSSREYTQDQSSMRRLIKMTDGGSMEFATRIGHDLLDLLQRWDELGVKGFAVSGAERGPVQCVGAYLMDKHTAARRHARDAEPVPDIAQRSIGRGSAAEALRRQSTSNWSCEGLGQPELQAAEIDAILREHDGEVRVWQCHQESWKPQIDKFDGSEAETRKRYGGDWAQTMVEQTAAARGAAFLRTSLGQASNVASCRKPVVDFSERYWVATFPGLHVGRPDFDNAVSTICVRGESSGVSPRANFFLRNVNVVTLAELYENYRHDATWEEIYDAFLECRVIYRKRSDVIGGVRGRAGGKKRKHGRKQNRRGGSWWQTQGWWQQGWWQTTQGWSWKERW